MAERQETHHEELSAAHLRPSCVACMYHCNRIHGNRDVEGEKFDPDRSWPFFRKKVSKLSLHQAPQSAICIPPAFMEDYPNAFQRGRPITLEGPSGNTWKVAAVDRSVLHLGWRAFAHDHRLREGDVLDFNLTKPSHFVVDIFSGNGDVRRSARNAKVTGKYPAVPPGLVQEIDRLSRKRKMAAPDMRIIPVGQQLRKLAPESSALKRRVIRSDFNVVERDITRTASMPGGPRLKFCEKTKQWKSHGSTPQERDQPRREVVNLDDSDDEDPAAPKIMQVYKRSNSSAHPSRIGRRVDLMLREELLEELDERYRILPAPSSTPSPVIQVVSLDGDDDHQVLDHPRITHKLHIAGRDDGDDGGHHDYLEESEEDLASNPLRQFTTMFDTRPRKLKLSKEDDRLVVGDTATDSGGPKSDSNVNIDHSISDLLSQQQVSQISNVPMIQAVTDHTVTNVQGRRDSDELAKTELNDTSPDLNVEDNKFLSPQNILSIVSRDTTHEEVAMVGQIPKPKLELTADLNAAISDSSDQPTSPGDASQVTELKTPSKPTPMTKSTSESSGGKLITLISKRGGVAPGYRDRAFQAAQARARTLQNPNFVAVMKHTNVYTDFNMDIPVEFVEKSKMPTSGEVRVTLVSDAPPTNCKAVWKPTRQGLVISTTDQATTMATVIGAKLSADGWMNFSRSHSLEEGDVCVFEDLNKYPALRIKVHIFRVVELTHQRPVEAIDWDRHSNFKVPDQPRHKSLLVESS